jgi:hypothetical protein
MVGGLLLTAGALIMSTVFYGIGRIHGYDQCDKDQDEFNEFWKELQEKGLTPGTEQK